MHFNYSEQKSPVFSFLFEISPPLSRKSLLCQAIPPSPCSPTLQNTHLSPPLVGEHHPDALPGAANSPARALEEITHPNVLTGGCHCCSVFHFSLSSHSGQVRAGHLQKVLQHPRSGAGWVIQGDGRTILCAHTPPNHDGITSLLPRALPTAPWHSCAPPLLSSWNPHMSHSAQPLPEAHEGTKPLPFPSTGK